MGQFQRQYLFQNFPPGWACLIVWFLFLPNLTSSPFLLQYWSLISKFHLSDSFLYKTKPMKMSARGRWWWKLISYPFMSKYCQENTWGLHVCNRCQSEELEPLCDSSRRESSMRRPEAGALLLQEFSLLDTLSHISVSYCWAETTPKLRVFKWSVFRSIVKGAGRALVEEILMSDDCLGSPWLRFSCFGSLSPFLSLCTWYPQGCKRESFFLFCFNF